ncbi:helix-turn-helix transcriptional regulator [Halomonas elongata]|uniref:HTH/PAS domain protein n=2 Tax=Halomonas elongata TaxID=2746 RepID=E1V511_HALED|nr:helix-turn-helix transcriptional regulator [Halomonas elongata]MBW5800514.1 helix-turn-helix transcriptional regulator [Halomonas elongata]RAW08426.1 XRE family transcriptional regulator [Halomonas elongata]WBF18297.1 helix-turn-helix transcriptional regulator [Halomonas elongata]WPU47149.1 helix-turn-helix transcriptional regulator [Halomonas elongata DSM 2581]WVI71824.1 helix-turn-helix transcriptional regulator [Halomonas elongata]
MCASRSLARTRPELADFLRSRRERLSPEMLGLPRGNRRRTPGLRREEVAALAGVGVTWYTWLEQGRDIGVSTGFLDSLARVLRLDAAERRHLYLLVHQRPPTESKRTWCTMPSLAQRLLDDLPHRPAYVLNLRWDVLAWNTAADRIFDFSAQPPERRNLLWMLFVDDATRRLFDTWEQQAPRLVSSFRQDYASAPEDSDIEQLVRELEDVAPEFKTWWRQQDIHGPCLGRRSLFIPDIGTLDFEHMTLTLDEDRHLRLVYYAACESHSRAGAFEDWLKTPPITPG